MTYEELVRSVEAAAAQKNSEILQRANREAEEIIREAEAKASDIKSGYLKEGLRRAAVERNRQIYLTSEEIKAAHSRITQDLFSQAFLDAGEKLKDIRNSPGYPGLLRKLLEEAVSRAGNGADILHIADTDAGICKISASDLGILEIQGDIESAGGISLSSRDGKITVYNTVESRLERAKNLYKLEIFRKLTGD